jgi:hypothetical protein
VRGVAYEGGRVGRKTYIRSGAGRKEIKRICYNDFNIITFSGIKTWLLIYA